MRPPAALSKPATRFLTDGTAPSVASRNGGAWMITVLASIYACHLLDRSIMQVLLEPVRKEFHLSDSQLGLLAGLVVALGYAVAAVPIGILTDRVRRTSLLTACVAAWSGLTLLCGLSGNFLLLLVSRIGVGAAEAGGQPLVMSIVGDITTPGRRAQTVGLVHVGIPIGTLLGGLLGSLVAARYGWRYALFAAGAPGLVIALIVALTLREPPRTIEASDTDREGVGLADYMRFLRARPALLCTMGGMVVVWFVSGAYAAFMVSLLVRLHNMPLEVAALTISFLAAGCGALGNLLSGFLADRFTKGAPDRLAWFAAGAALLHVPLRLIAVLAPDTRLALVGYAAMIVAYFSVFTPGNTLAVTLATSRTRGRVVATVGIGSTLLGYGLGPQVTGILSDLLRPALGEQSLRYALVVVMLVMLLAVALFALAGWFQKPAGQAIGQGALAEG